MGTSTKIVCARSGRIIRVIRSTLARGGAGPCACSPRGDATDPPGLFRRRGAGAAATRNRVETMRSRLLTWVSMLAIVWPATAPLAQQTAPSSPPAQQGPISVPAGQVELGPAALAQPSARPAAEEGPDDNFLETYERYYLYPRAYPKLVESPSRRTRAFAQARKMRPYRFDPKAESQPPASLAAVGRRRAYGSYPPGSPNGPGWPNGAGNGAPGQTDMAGCAWVSRGPTNINGRITSIAVDPNNNQHIFAAGVGGLWRSLDKARTWERVSDDFLARIFASIAVNPHDGTEVVAGGGDPNYESVPSGSGLGIWRSTSSGQAGSWTKISPPELDGHLIYRLRYDTAAPYNVYAATTNGLYLGTRDASNNLTFTRLGGFDAGVEDFVVDTSVTPHKVYAAVRDASATYAKGVWKYDGTSWTKRDSGIPTASIGTIALALAQSAPSTLYAKISRPRDGSATGGNLLDVYKTTTGGETPGGGGNAWTGLGATPLDDSHFNDGSGYSWYNSLIEVDPANANIVWAAGLSLWRSTTGGSAGSWVNVGGGVGVPGGEGAHSDSHALAFDPVNSKIIYDGNDGGITRSADSSAATWGMFHVSHNQTSGQFYKATQQWTPVSFLAGGSQDNGTEITYGGRAWLQPGGCDGADVAIDAVDASTLYANCNGGLYELVNPVPGTPGGGSTASWTLPAGLNPNPPIASDFRTAGAALMAANRTVAPTPGNMHPWQPISLLKTTDGLTWSSITSDLPTYTIFTFEAIAPSSSFQTYYVGVVGGSSTPNIWRTTNGGTSWQTTATGIPNQYPTRVAVDYTNASRAFATFSSGAGGQVTMTTDGGATWNAIMGSGASALPAAADYTGVAVDPNNASVIYVASDVGMFRGVVTTPASGTPTAAWTSFNEGLPDGLDVTDVTADPSTGFLSIGTFGWGEGK